MHLQNKNSNSYKLYHCGSSSKDSGSSITTISKIEEKELYEDVINEILESDELLFE